MKNGKDVRFFNFEALTRPQHEWERFLRIAGIKNLEISDPTVQDQLTKDQFDILCKRFTYLAPKVRKAEPLPLVESEPPSIDGIPDEHTFVMQTLFNGKMRMVDRPYEDGKPVEIVAEQPQTEPAKKRGRKPKQA